MIDAEHLRDEIGRLERDLAMARQIIEVQEQRLDQYEAQQEGLFRKARSYQRLANWLERNLKRLRHNDHDGGRYRLTERGMSLERAP